MLDSRKSQAVLPFFALNLAALLIFFIVLLSLFSMAKNVRFSLDEFNLQSISMLSQRRIVSSADCFAYEAKDITFDSAGNLLSGHTVYPGMIDVNKLTDIDYFNCMRKDKYDIDVNFYENGGWDAEEAAGASLRYAIAVYDLVTHKHIFYADKTDSFKQNEVNSVLLRVHKAQGNCNDYFSDVCEDISDKWDCIDHCSYEQLQYDNPLHEKCWPGRCEYQAGTLQIEGTDIKPYWEIKSPYLTAFDTELILPSLRYALGGTNVFAVGGDDEINPSGYRWITWIPDDPVPNADDDEQMDAYTISCDGQRSAERAVMLVSLKYENEVHPGIFIFESCIVKGAKYDGINVLEKITVKASAGECY